MVWVIGMSVPCKQLNRSSPLSRAPQACLHLQALVWVTQWCLRLKTQPKPREPYSCRTRATLSLSTKYSPANQGTTRWHLCGLKRALGTLMSRLPCLRLRQSRGQSWGSLKAWYWPTLTWTGRSCLAVSSRFRLRRLRRLLGWRLMWLGSWLRRWMGRRVLWCSQEGKLR